MAGSYDAQARLASIADSHGRQVRYTQEVLVGDDYSGNLTALTGVSQIVPVDETQPLPRWTYGWMEVPVSESAEYDTDTHGSGSGYGPWTETLLLLTSITTPSPSGGGESTARLRWLDEVYKVAETVDANGITTLYAYGNQQLLTAVMDADSNLLQQVARTFDSRGVLTHSGLPGSPSFIYGDSANPSKVTRIDYPDGRHEVMTYDSHGNLVSQTDARGTVIENTWDYTNFAFGRLTQVTRTPDGGPTRVVAAYTYDEPSGLVLTATTLEPGTTDGSTVTVSYTYDDLGNVLTVATPGNNAATTLTTTYEYETDGTYTTTAKVGQPIKVSCPGTCARHYRYDARGNRTLYTDALGNTWETVYNLADQTIVSYEPATGQQGTGRARRVMTYAWTGGPQTELTVYDEAGNVVQHINTDYGAEGETLAVSGGTEPVAYAYDGLYRVVTLTDGNGNVTRYAYDSNDRLALTRYPGATADTGADTLRQTSYDLAGRLLQRIDGNNLTCNFAYNEAGGALTNVSYPTQSAYNVTYGHDTLGRVTSMSDAQGTIATTYDDLGNPLTVTTTYTGLDPQVVEYTYYPNGQRASMNTPGGLFEYEYSVNGQMTSLDGPAGTASWTWLDNQQLGARTLPCGAWSEFTYLPNGRLSTLTNKDDQGAVMSRYLDLQYRGTGDLQHWEAQVTGSTSHSGDTDYAYDLRRELTGETSERNGGYADAYAYDNAGNPTSWRGATRTFNSDNQETTGANWTYDGNGNPTSYGGTTCTYDVANHLTGFGSGFTAGYRGDGLRAWQQSGTTRKYYVYDGWRPVCELDDEGAVLRSWTFGADGLVAVGSEQALCDWQGNAAHWWDGSTWTLGAVLGGYGAAGAGYKWRHGYLDCGEDLILCTYRHLDPALGRWLTRDPIGHRGGIGLYGYVSDGPITNGDSKGLDACGADAEYPGHLKMTEWTCADWCADKIANERYPSSIGKGCVGALAGSGFSMAKSALGKILAAATAAEALALAAAYGFALAYISNVLIEGWQCRVDCGNAVRRGKPPWDCPYHFEYVQEPTWPEYPPGCGL
ncbi:MAG: RHS repeat protein [Armatimonadetes bacterium]|nr:RHS repeat protein [Armatimonadota bacterium]